jgi:hypothetical protein
VFGCLQFSHSEHFCYRVRAQRTDYVTRSSIWFRKRNLLNCYDWCICLRHDGAQGCCRPRKLSTRIIKKLTRKFCTIIQARRGKPTRTCTPLENITCGSPLISARGDSKPAAATKESSSEIISARCNCQRSCEIGA